MQWLGLISAYKLFVILKLKNQSSKVQFLASILITTEQGILLNLSYISNGFLSGNNARPSGGS
jgi:hypothetical protein